MSPGALKRKMRKGTRANAVARAHERDIRAAEFLKSIQADYVRRHTSEE